VIRSDRALISSLEGLRNIMYDLSDSGLLRSELGICRIAVGSARGQSVRAAFVSNMPWFYLFFLTHE